MNLKANKSSKEKYGFRNSPITELLHDKHFRTTYNLFVAFFLGLIINSTVRDYVKNGQLVPEGLKLVIRGYSKLHVVFLAWFISFLLTCSAYFLLKIWAKNRSFNNTRHTRIWDAAWLFLATSGYVYLIASAPYVTTKFEVPFGSALLFFLEQLGLIFKFHAYIRSSIVKVLNSKSGIDLPKFSHFLYFMSIPACIYQDSYPRREKIDWKFLYSCILQCLFCMICQGYVLDGFFNPTVQDFGLRKYTIGDIILSIFENTITGALLLVTFCIIYLQSICNIHGELTRFGDRFFYSDWWTCTSFPDYFRKSSIAVQDWLYIYVYKDFKENIFRGNTTKAKIAVFFISVAFHEWILASLFGFFFPSLFFLNLLFVPIVFSLGTPKHPLFNALFLYLFPFGLGFLITMYGIESYARTNVPIPNPVFKDYFIPRFLTCDCIKYG